MTLYDSIMEYELRAAKLIANRASKRFLRAEFTEEVLPEDLGEVPEEIGQFMKNLFGVSIDFSVDHVVRKSELTLKFANKFKHWKIKDEDITDLANEIYSDPPSQFFIHHNPEYLPIAKDCIKARAEFYQRVLQHEGECENYQDALRTEFKNPSSYLDAIEPITQAERRMGSYTLTGISHLQMMNFFLSLFEAEIETRESTIRQLFYERK